MDFIFNTVFIILYIPVTAGLCWLFLKFSKNFHPIVRLTISSFLYALFYGIGAVSSGPGEPGFALPAPVLVALIGTMPVTLINAAIIPLIFWWTVIFTVKFTLYRIKVKKLNSADT